MGNIHLVKPRRSRAVQDHVGLINAPEHLNLLNMPKEAVTSFGTDDSVTPQTVSAGGGSSTQPASPAPQPTQSGKGECPPLPSQSDVDAMDCATLQQAWQTGENNSGCYQTPQDIYIQWQQIQTYMAQQINNRCQLAAPPTESPVQPPGTVPPVPAYPTPAQTSEIDSWDCPTITAKRDEYNNILAVSSLDAGTRSSYENALLYINSRYQQSCVPQEPHPLENPPAGGGTEPPPPPPLPSTADIDGLDCNSLAATKVGLVTNEAAYRYTTYDLQSYTNTLAYIDKKTQEKCQVSPTTEQPKVPIATLLGGGGGGGSSSQGNNTPASAIKKYWWLGLVAIGAAFLLYKPGMKPGTIQQP